MNWQAIKQRLNQSSGASPKPKSKPTYSHAGFNDIFGSQKSRPAPKIQPASSTSSSGYSGQGSVSSRPEPRPQPQPVSKPTYNPPAANSSGQYSGGTQSGGGRPSAPPKERPGQVNRPGKPENKAPKGPQGTKQPKKEQAGKIQSPGQEPAVPSIDEFLAGDTTYNSAISELQKALELFGEQNQESTTRTKSDFELALQRLNEERMRSLQSMEEDFAARGLLNSGLYTEAVGDYDSAYNQRLGDLSTDQQRVLGDLGADLTSQQNLNTSAVEQARLDAIRRRAQQYGITI